MAHLTIPVWFFKTYAALHRQTQDCWLSISKLLVSASRDIWEYFTHFRTSINIQWDWVTRIDLHISSLCRTCKEWGDIVLSSSFDSEKSWLSEPWASVAPHPPELILNQLLRHVRGFEHSHRLTESSSHGKLSPSALTNVSFNRDCYRASKHPPLLWVIEVWWCEPSKASKSWEISHDYH